MLEGLFSPAHLIIILTIALIVLGPKRLPEAGRSLGGAIRSFKQALADDERDDPPAVAEKSDSER